MPLGTVGGHLGVKADVGERRLQLMGDLIDERNPLLRHADLTGAFMEVKPASTNTSMTPEPTAEHDGEEVGLGKLVMAGV
jgi:hypothetical protein